MLAIGVTSRVLSYGAYESWKAWKWMVCVVESCDCTGRCASIDHDIGENSNHGLVLFLCGILRVVFLCGCEMCAFNASFKRGSCILSTIVCRVVVFVDVLLKERQLKYVW